MKSLLSTSARLLANPAPAGSDLAALLLRFTLAVVMFPHGAQKLLGWFGGYGFAGTVGFFTGTMGIPWILAVGVVLTEFFAPLLLVIGLFTRPAAIALGTVMTVAMITVSAQFGFFMNWSGNQKGEGIEFALLYIGGALALLVLGGGRWALDRLFVRHNG